jgi:hypothetical protein
VAEDLTNVAPADRSRINVDDDHERRFWCKELICTERQLRDAVRAVGVSVDEVREHLRRSR